jgi:hypothetical protein
MASTLMSFLVADSIVQGHMGWAGRCFDFLRVPKSRTPALEISRF